MNFNKENSLQKSICEEFGIDYAVLGEIYARIILWHKELTNEFDKLGISQRICKDISNILFSTPVRIYTQDPNVNHLIKEEMYGRLRLNEQLSRHIPHFLGLGNGLLTVYRDAIDMKPAINYIPAYNVIPISYNNHSVQELVWFNLAKDGEDFYLICTIERKGSREVRLYNCNFSKLTMIDYGTPIWQRVMGNIQANVEETIPNPAIKFAWFSTGLFNAKWMDTPYTNSFIWNIELIKKIEKSYDMLNEEYKNSAKRLFISPDLVNTSIDMSNGNGQAQRVKKFDPNSTLFEVLDVGEEMIREWNPTLRFIEFKEKIVMDFKILGQQIGLGAEYYNLDNPKIEMTATQVILSNRDAFNTINVVKYNLESILKIITKGMIDYWVEDGLLPVQYLDFPMGEIGVEFDDGVFINKSAKVVEGSNLFSMGLIDHFTFLTRYADYTDGEANEIIQRKQQEMIQQLQLQMAVEGPQKEEKKGDKKDGSK